ncbi:MAG: oxidoreductase [Chlorobi bacterium]|nr:oxidoreductase [Chlorobiota bacterium]
MKAKKGVDRRDFLRKSVLGATGAVLVTGAGHAAGAGSDSPDEKKKMIIRKLGRTGIELPVVSMGVMRADNPGLVKAALDHGMVLLDTAHDYQKGRNEEMLGKLLKDYPRDQFVIATKVQPDGIDRKTGNPTKETSPEKFREMFDISLQRLQMDYVDILYMHAISAREMVMYKPILRVMKSLKRKGKVRFIGVSTHKNEPEVIRAVIDAKVYDVVLTAYNFKQDHLDGMHKAFEKAGVAGIGIIAMKTMAGGFQDKERQHPVNTKAALKWALQNPYVTTSIPGFTAFDQIDEDAEVMFDLTLTDEEKKDLEPVSLAGLYCNGCEHCVAQCRESLPIPELMRAYMYTYGYRETQKARDLLTDIGVMADTCSDCDNCTVRCVKGFAVAEKIADVTRLLQVPEDFLT